MCGAGRGRPGRAWSDTPNHAECSGYLSSSGTCSSDDAVLIVDETGDLEKGVRTVGVQR